MPQPPNCDYENRIDHYCRLMKSALQELGAVSEETAVAPWKLCRRIDAENRECVRGLFFPSDSGKYEEFKQTLDEHFVFHRELRFIYLK